MRLEKMPNSYHFNRRNLFHRKVGNDLDVIVMDDQHFLNTNAVSMSFSMLGLQGKNHTCFDLNRVVQRPDTGDDRRIVLREAETVPPQISGCLVFLVIAPGFFCGRPF